MNRKTIAICCASAISLFLAGAEPVLWRAVMGANFFEYRYASLDTGLQVVIPLQEGLYVETGATFSIFPSRDDFFCAVPVNVGVDFGFEFLPYSLLVGIGVEPLFAWERGDFAFRFGPYLKAEAKMRVHSHMEVGLVVEQALYFGGPDYVSAGTRAGAAIIFSF